MGIFFKGIYFFFYCVVFSYEIVKFCQFIWAGSFIYLKFISQRQLPGSGSEMIFPYPDPAKKFRIRPDPDPDPQHCYFCTVPRYVKGTILITPSISTRSTALDFLRTGLKGEPAPACWPVAGVPGRLLSASCWPRCTGAPGRPSSSGEAVESRSSWDSDSGR